MSLSINAVVVGGNVTRDPEVKMVGQTTVAKFGIAINDKYKDRDGNTKETVCFVDIEAWGKTADLISQYVHCGDRLVVEGKLKSDSWQTQNGEKRQKLLMRADRVHFVSSKRDDAPAPVQAQAHKQPSAAVVDDEPPF